MNLIEVSPQDLVSIKKFISLEDEKKIDKAVGKVINLQRVIEAGGYRYQKFGFTDNRRLPRLAVGKGASVRVDMRKGRVTFISDWTTAIGMDISWARIEPDVVGKLPPLPREAKRLLEVDKATMVLWEATYTNVAPLEDPAIVRQLVGNLWEVLHIWDLSEVEKEALRTAGV